MLNSSITDSKELINVNDNINNSNCDLLTVLISLPHPQMVQVDNHQKGRKRDRERDVTRNAVVEARNIKVFALLDSGCLVGDCMSQNIVDKLQATHLLVHVNTTICSGFDNKCDSSFPSLLINISFINEITSLRESFITSVFILHMFKLL